MKLRVFAHMVLVHWGISVNKSISVGNSPQKSLRSTCEILLRKYKKLKLAPFACYVLLMWFNIFHLHCLTWINKYKHTLKCILDCMALSVYLTSVCFSFLTYEKGMFTLPLKWSSEMDSRHPLELGVYPGLSTEGHQINYFIFGDRIVKLNF